VFSDEYCPLVRYSIYTDVSRVVNMDGVFGGNRGSLQFFNSDISNWDVSQVTDMQAMFQKTWAFNQDISQWDVSRVSKSTVFVSDYCPGLSLRSQNSPMQFPHLSNDANHVWLVKEL
jgi:Mycoplasma protein of unknown function, DUF285